MALTQNEQLIIKYVGQNYLTKESMENLAPAYAVGDTPYAADWLSKTIDGTPLIPIEGRFYFVCNLGKVYTWDKTSREYIQANLPDTITAEDVDGMWE